MFEKFAKSLRALSSDREEPATPFEEKTLFLGLGPTKTGTTWLHRYLGDHPEFYATPVKEMHFFSLLHHTGPITRYEQRSIKHLKRLLEEPDLRTNPSKQAMFAHWAELLVMGDDPGRYIDYFRRMTDADHKAFGEMSPSYCSLTADGYRLIKAIHPKVRVMICLRDPMERADAVLRHLWKHGNQVPYDEYFDSHLPKRLESHNMYYDRLLEPIFEVFDEHELRVQFFETLFTQRSLDEIADFIGISHRPGNFDDRPAHSPPAERMTDNHRDRLKEELAPTYVALRRRFGERIPESWELP